MDRLKRVIKSPTPYHDKDKDKTYKEYKDEREGKSELVKVAVRMKPNGIDTKDSSNTTSSPWHVKPFKVELDAKYCEKFKKHTFSANYDLTFTGNNNVELYEEFGRNIVHSAMDGYNGTLFAYGQTSSDYGTEDDPGIIPQAVDDIFKYIKRAGNTKEYLLRVAYIEIYNETVHDLLAPESGDLKIHEDRQRGVYVAPLKEEIVTSPKQVMKIIDKGEANRHVACNDYHEHSSRSHTIFQIVIESCDNGSSALSSIHKRRGLSFQKKKEPTNGVKLSQLNLIDLAGSEKITTDLDRRKEAAFINKSLLNLGAVISKLAEGRGGHIPFRDSKLTRILQTTLSGNSRIGVICTFNSAGSYVDDTLNTLKFGSRIKTVTTKAHTNKIVDDKALLQKYQGEINNLKTKLNQANLEIEKAKDNELEDLREKNQKYEEEVMELNLARTAYKERIDHLTKLILTSNSMGDKIFKRSRPMSVHISNANAPQLLQRWSILGNKQKEKTDNMDTMLADLKFKTRYIQELESLLLSLSPDYSSTASNPKEVYQQYLQIQKMKATWDVDSQLQENEQTKEIEKKVTNTLGRVASLRMSRNFGSMHRAGRFSSMHITDPRESLKGIHSSLSYDPNLTNNLQGITSSLNVVTEPTEIHDTKSQPTPFSNPIANPTTTHSPPQPQLPQLTEAKKELDEEEVAEMEEIIEEQNKIIVDLEQERKLLTRTNTDLKQRIHRLELQMFKRAEQAASNNLTLPISSPIISGTPVPEAPSADITAVATNGNSNQEDSTDIQKLTRKMLELEVALEAERTWRLNHFNKNNPNGNLETQGNHLDGENLPPTPLPVPPPRRIRNPLPTHLLDETSNL